MKKRLAKIYKIFCLAPSKAQPDWEGAEEYPDLILNTLVVPYVDNAIMPAFHEWYTTLEEAEADIPRIAPMDGAQYIILPVYVIVKDYDIPSTTHVG